ncbi:hypothetical protein SLEP1_g13099 [Rubroshorea leprosula]|uniref:Uncharacterized protein n=1 Tax=Rubroshorea leprosula TaxID=152421 RepID=A0AAV5IMR5_9ROSI|nr:hypothetical protein SLEP1_g13099 [Rubroshorea leprosula]
MPSRFDHFNCRNLHLNSKGSSFSISPKFPFLSQDMDDKRLTYTLDEALDAAGFGKFQVLVLSYAGLDWFAEAMEVMILSFIGPAVKSEWNLS